MFSWALGTRVSCILMRIITQKSKEVAHLKQ